tara:strand:+ start:160 stop:627 length:468 start_codon:yes stop_codon:yes gene_type:complete
MINLLDAFIADICQHILLYGWWFSPVAACSLAATCKHLRMHLEPQSWSCRRPEDIEALFERTLHRAQLTQLSLLRKHVQRLVNIGFGLQGEPLSRLDVPAGTIVSIGQTLEQMRDRRLAFATRDALSRAVLETTAAEETSMIKSSPGARGTVRDR